MSHRCLTSPGLSWAYLAVVALAGCSEVERKKDESPRVKVARPIVRDVNDWQFFIGRTDAVESVNIQAQVTGALWSIDFVEGTEVHADVRKDQRLFKIDPRPYQAAYDQAVGQVNLAKARLTLTIADYKRALEVAKTPGAISQQDIDKYAAAEGEARAEVAAQKANQEAALINLKFTDITSPITGRASRNLKTTGNIIKQNETLLGTVVSQDPIFVYFDVDDRTMLRIKRLMQEGKVKPLEDGGGFPMYIGLPDEGDQYPHPGVLEYVSNQLDPSTGTIQVRGKFANPPVVENGPRLLEPEQFVRVKVSLGPPYPALLVPQAALGTDQGKKYLLVLTDQGKNKNVVEYRPVEVGQEQPGALQVVKPLPMVKTEDGLQPATMGPEGQVGTVPSVTAEDRVIIDGLQFAPRGKSVHPVLVELKAPADLPRAPAAATSPPAAKPSTADSKPQHNKSDDVPLPPAPNEKPKDADSSTAAPAKPPSEAKPQPEVPLPPPPAEYSTPPAVSPAR